MRATSAAVQENSRRQSVTARGSFNTVTSAEIIAYRWCGEERRGGTRQRCTPLGGGALPHTPVGRCVESGSSGLPGYGTVELLCSAPAEETTRSGETEPQEPERREQGHECL
ncbi:hypothetical protein JOB18_022976 [Solea senegalensis]|uniref:Uncharacterized protein n=1 Tax=Solea senegalensis TaxID=28829 RepID=A0AAV6QX39_SOLSE|nr:hypothetical protein JOB18_022976 [Solea senegalensis]